MEQEHCPLPTNGELGFFPSPGSSADIDLSRASGFAGLEVESSLRNWESAWIDIGGEG
jgi:hypothetical protein